MRKTALLALVLVLMAFLVGCNDDESVVGPSKDPVPPQGVYSVTGDGAVVIHWDGVYDNNITEYIVYRSAFPDSGYVEIGSVMANADAEHNLWPYSFEDTDVANSYTYYYAVTSVDSRGRESKLSAELVVDTPRPQGRMTLSPANSYPGTSGFNFETETVVSYNSLTADIYMDTLDGIYYLNAVGSSTDLMDMGYTDDFDVISASPSIDTLVGWTELPWVELVIGHTYVVWTADNHFAKVRPYQLHANGSISFDWAWQEDIGNPQLVPGSENLVRPQHDTAYIAKLRASRAQESM